MENVVIVGSGPCGLTASIYLARSRLAPIVICGDAPGGLITTTDSIENFPGFKSISGSDLMMKITDQAETLGVRLIFDKVEKIDESEDGFKVTLSNGDIINTKSTLIATGSTHRHLGMPSESAFANKGVSWCATCDGPFFKNKTVAVIGGGNTAVVEALFLSNLAEKVYVVHRRDRFTADKVMTDKLLNNEKIEVIWNSEVKEFKGTDSLEGIQLINNKTNEENFLKVDGAFVAIGIRPVSEMVDHLVDTKDGYIIVDGSKTSKPGLFAAGDVTLGSLRQAVYTAGMGAYAAREIENYLGVR